MPFPKDVVEDALVACGRCCCICHKFCGVRIETHHIEEEAAGGPNSFDNCIPLCFDCHAEVKHYNDKHPRGRKFTANELRRHRDHWYQRVEKLQGPDKEVPEESQSQIVIGSENVVAGRDININKKVVKRNEVRPDPGGRHITEEQALRIRDLVGKYVDTQKEAGQHPTPGKLYAKLYKDFQVPSYREIALSDFNTAVTWLQQQIALLRPKLRRRNPAAWRNQYYTAIYARARSIGMTKEDVYDLAFQNLDLRHPISSLKELTQRNLQLLDRIIANHDRSLAPRNQPGLRLVRGR